MRGDVTGECLVCGSHVTRVFEHVFGNVNATLHFVPFAFNGAGIEVDSFAASKFKRFMFAVLEVRRLIVVNELTIENKLSTYLFSMA